MTELMFSVIEQAAKSQLRDGHASMKRGGDELSPSVSLEPEKDSAAGLEVFIDSATQVTCFPGSNGMVLEVFSKDSAEIAEEVRGLAEAVASGGYSERVNDSGTHSKVVAEWRKGGNLRSPRLNVLFAPRPGSRRWRNWRVVSYEPY